MTAPEIVTFLERLVPARQDQALAPPRRPRPHVDIENPRGFSYAEGPA